MFYIISVYFEASKLHIIAFDADLGGNDFTTSSEIHHLQYSALPLNLSIMEHLCWLVILYTSESGSEVTA